MKSETRKFGGTKNRAGFGGGVPRFALAGALASLSILPVIPASAAAAGALPTEGFDVREAIDCKMSARAYARFKRYFEYNREEVARKFQWKLLDSTPQRDKYELPAPIEVAGGYSARRIAFMDTQVFAVLDSADAEAIAEREGIKDGPGKYRNGFMRERVLSDTKEPPGEDGFGWSYTLARVVRDHPADETFYGCSYRIWPLGKDGKRLKLLEPARALPKAAN